MIKFCQVSGNVKVPCIKWTDVIHYSHDVVHCNHHKIYTLIFFYFILGLAPPKPSFKQGKNKKRNHNANYSACQTFSFTRPASLSINSYWPFGNLNTCRAQTDKAVLKKNSQITDFKKPRTAPGN